MVQDSTETMQATQLRSLVHLLNLNALVAMRKGMLAVKLCFSKILPVRPAGVILWLDHLGTMCSRTWPAPCAVGSRFTSSRGPGKARPPT